MNATALSWWDRTRRWTALAMLCASLLAGCESSAPPPPNIVLILVDQLRKDTADQHLAGVNRLAERGIVAHDMRTPAPWTYPSVISLMSGLYPQQHGANGHLTEQTLTTFDASLPLLPRLLRDQGYATAGFVTNPFFQTFNAFHEGFDHYDISFIGDQANFVGLRTVWTERMFANSVNDAVTKYFDSTPVSGPEFTYVHYIDAHGPWGGAPFISDDLLDKVGMLSVIRAHPEWTEEELAKSLAWDDQKERLFYETSVRYLDTKIVELYQQALARYDGNLVFIVTSDHGRVLGDDASVGAGAPWREQKRSLHDFNLQIPFMILPSRVVTERIDIAVPTSNIDVAPTLLTWAGVAPAVTLPGVDLLPRRTRAFARDDRTLYAEVSAFGYKSDAALLRGRKFVRWFDVKSGNVERRRIFDLDRDSREVSPIAADFEAGQRLLDAFVNLETIKFEGTFKPIPDDVQRRLRSLGYLK
jgi:arylsulfatase